MGMDILLRIMDMDKRTLAMMRMERAVATTHTAKVIHTARVAHLVQIHTAREIHMAKVDHHLPVQILMVKVGHHLVILRMAEADLHPVEHRSSLAREAVPARHRETYRPTKEKQFLDHHLRGMQELREITDLRG